MAFVKLLPTETLGPLSVPEVVSRLRDEFDFVDECAEDGRDHVASMIAAVTRMSDSLPGKQERLEWLQSVQDAAVYVVFGDGPGLAASCCLMPDSELFFGSPGEVDGEERPLVNRAAAALNYELYEG